ncbi:HORMA domain-containing protein 1 [Cricetulus griseus]|uniref:HORMA domain-containing protein 1 n=1 Tax=Cricetulus griseus TaxID=10029 RepID=A0A061INL7_CRIGR|nr:HORMA domain-containing protein 1 [Cricetulus griseus]
MTRDQSARRFKFKDSWDLGVSLTPPDYQPPGFKDGDCEGVIFDGNPTYLNVGEVPTPFHTFRLKVTTEKDRMENIDSTILTPKQSKIPFRKILMDKDDGEDENHNNFDIKTKMDEQKENLGASEIKEPNLDCKGEEIMQLKKNPSPSITHCQVEQLVSKTSELDVSESKTRSGKIFQSKMVNGSQQGQTSKEYRKRSLRQPVKTVLHFSESSSEESSTKRKRVSEPKEHT